MATTSSNRRVKSHKHEEHESCYFMKNAEPTEDKSFLNKQQRALVEYLDNRAEERAGSKKIDESKIDHNRKNPQEVLDFIRAKIQSISRQLNTTPKSLKCTNSLKKTWN
mmetsp:Transcript_15867/g.22694  ORF Transcript_15867/g.22694 Transcript_15867/m.22694 type:complete len:109 (-) Transcript_15867:328-654(-)